MKAVRVIVYVFESFLTWMSWWLKPGKYPPGPRGPWAAINSVRAFMSPSFSKGYYDRLFAKYGKLVMAPGPFFHFFVYVADAELHHEITMNWKDFNRSDFQQAFAHIIGRIIGEDSQEQQRRRKLINPPLAEKNLRFYVPLFQESTLKLLKSWTGRGEVPITTELIAFFSDISAQLLQGGAKIEKGLGLKVIQLLVLFQRNPLSREFKEAFKYVSTVVADLLREATGTQRGILSVFAQQIVEGKMTEEEAIAEVIGFFNASVETTSNTLSWLLYFLANDPEKMRKAQDEVDRVLGASDFNAAHLGSLSYLYQCVDEATRLSPPVWRQLRKTPKQGVSVMFFGREYHLPQHAQIFNFVRIIQTDPEVWGQDAEKFDPEAHMIDQVLKNIPKGSFQPFSSGIHMCPGLPLAKMNMMLMASYILSQFDIGFEESHQPVYGLVLSFPPQAMMSLTPRSQ